MDIGRTSRFPDVGGRRALPAETINVIYDVMAWARTEKGREAMRAAAEGQQWGELELGGAIFDAMSQPARSAAP